MRSWENHCTDDCAAAVMEGGPTSPGKLLRVQRADVEENFDEKDWCLCVRKTRSAMRIAAVPPICYVKKMRAGSPSGVSCRAASVHSFTRSSAHVQFRVAARQHQCTVPAEEEAVQLVHGPDQLPDSIFHCSSDPYPYSYSAPLAVLTSTSRRDSPDDYRPHALGHHTTSNLLPSAVKPSAAETGRNEPKAEYSDVGGGGHTELFVSLAVAQTRGMAIR